MTDYNSYDEMDKTKAASDDEFLKEIGKIKTGQDLGLKVTTDNVKDIKNLSERVNAFPDIIKSEVQKHLDKELSITDRRQKLFQWLIGIGLTITAIVVAILALKK